MNDTRAARRLALLLVVLCALAPAPAHADCVDPQWCFANDQEMLWAVLGTAALLAAAVFIPPLLAEAPAVLEASLLADAGESLAAPLVEEGLPTVLEESMPAVADEVVPTATDEAEMNSLAGEPTLPRGPAPAPGPAPEPSPPTAGETADTQFGKQFHRDWSVEARDSGLHDDVNRPITDTQGNPISVTRRVDLRTGRPLPESGYQRAVPDAIKYSDGRITDIKPWGRSLARDKQEFVRFIRAYKIRTGELPKTIQVPRYSRLSGKLVTVEDVNVEAYLTRICGWRLEDLLKLW